MRFISHAFGDPKFEWVIPSAIFNRYLRHDPPPLPSSPAAFPVCLPLLILIVSLGTAFKCHSSACREEFHSAQLSSAICRRRAELFYEALAPNYVVFHAATLGRTSYLPERKFHPKNMHLRQKRAARFQSRCLSSVGWLLKGSVGEGGGFPEPLNGMT